MNGFRCKPPSRSHLHAGVLLALLTASFLRVCADDFAVSLPIGTAAVWDGAQAHKDSTPSRERMCLNGLWRWQPVELAVVTNSSPKPPADHWGYFKVPGCWPGLTDYMQKDSQTLHAHPAWQGFSPTDTRAAWYERTFEVAADWAGRRISLSADVLNSYARVFIDGQDAGELRYPGGSLNLTAACQPGRTHRLSLLVVAMPLKAVLASNADSAAAREVAGSVRRRGLCGDLWLTATPTGPRLTEVDIDPSVRERRLRIRATVGGMKGGERLRLKAVLTHRGEPAGEFTSADFGAADVADRQHSFDIPWMPEGLWDLHTPTNQSRVEVSLVDASESVRDTFWPVTFGFRELWVDGRDFRLNGSRIHLSAVPLDNAEVSAATASYPAARESLLRLKEIGINYVYTHNYGCEPGSHLAFEEILRAADDVGMLVGFSMPHFSHYDWKTQFAGVTNGYARHAEYYVGLAQHHPSVVFHVMSHNATGYAEDMNPFQLDGVTAMRDGWARKNVQMAETCASIVRGFDPGRIVYHHASGNLGPIHNMNFYPNFAPIQELSDWFGFWSTNGTKPVFLCEYGAPFTWDWTMYRGWYKGRREFGSAKVPWEFCLAEWNAQFLGDAAFRINDAERDNLRWEARQLRAGKTWHRWDYPTPPGSTRLDAQYPIHARYLTANWRAFRALGVSGISPWEHDHYWKLLPGTDRRRRELKVDWSDLQRPGYSADFIDRPYERRDLAYGREDWDATPAAEALLRNNRPLLAFIAGPATAVTSQDHHFLPGESVSKQILILNESRTNASCEVTWSTTLPGQTPTQRAVTVTTGERVEVPVGFVIAPGTPAGRHAIRLEARFDSGEVQSDEFAFEVLSPRPAKESFPGRIVLYDALGKTAPDLERLGIPFARPQAGKPPQSADLLIVGQDALPALGALPALRLVREGLRVLVFEQRAKALEGILGLRTVEYGLREVFPRVPDHPVFEGLGSAQWHDWRGSATLNPPRLDYQLDAQKGPLVNWCGLQVPRVWRCGNRGNVASTLIEKPARGDFLPLVDGGFSLQYSPLLEYREGRGVIVFCQLDVIARTDPDPAADQLVLNLVRHLTHWKPAESREAVYAGESAGLEHIRTTAPTVRPYQGDELQPGEVLIVGPGAAQALAGHEAAISRWLSAGGRVVGFGLAQANTAGWLPRTLRTKPAEHINAYFTAFEQESPFAGISPADVHNRDPRELPLVLPSEGWRVFGKGVLAQSTDGSVALSQIAPWQSRGTNQAHLRRTYRRAAFLANRLLANAGVDVRTDLLDRFATPPPRGAEEKGWLDGLYADRPEEWDDPYRFFRW